MAAVVTLGKMRNSPVIVLQYDRGLIRKCQCKHPRNIAAGASFY